MEVISVGASPTIVAHQVLWPTIGTALLPEVLIDHHWASPFPQGILWVGTHIVI